MKSGIVFSVLLVFILISCKDTSTNPIETGEISGQIIDGVTLNPISGVILTTTPITNSIMNNMDGTFSFTELSEGSYIIYAKKYGYNDAQANVRVKNGKSAQAVIRMFDLSITNNQPNNLLLIGPVDDSQTGSDVTFSWSCHDADNDVLHYDLLLSETFPPTQVEAENIPNTQHVVKNLDTSKTYYWQIIAKDKYSFIESDIYEFHVKSNSPVNEENLILYYSFDHNNAEDESMHGHDGTLKNNPQFVTGKIGKACKLVGTDDKLGTGSHILLPFINFKNYPKFSIALWVKEQNLDYFNGEAYINWGNATTGWVGISTFALPPEQTEAIYNFSVGCEFGDSYSRQKPVFATYDAEDAKNWKHLALVYSAGVVKAFINGNLVGSTANTIVNIENYGAIGKHWWTYQGLGSTSSLSFLVDEVRVYSKALTENEIQELAK